MINLLPENSKFILKRLYRERFLFICLIAIFLLVLASIVLIYPILESINSKNESVKQALSQAEARPVSREAVDIMQTVKDVNSKLALLSATSSSTSDSLGASISEILKYKKSGIYIKNFKFETDGTVTLIGMADSREVLIAFVNNLEADTSFTEVVSPISNLIKNKDIDFSISMRLAHAQK